MKNIFSRRSSGRGFVPGARVPSYESNNAGHVLQIGELDGHMGLQGFNSSFGRNVSSAGLGRGAGPGGIVASRADYSGVLEARRMQKLARTDPGLSTRGVRGAPGRGGRAVTGGLETRGVRGAPGRGGRAVTGGLEGRGVRPAAGERMLPRSPARIPGREYGAAERRMGRISRAATEGAEPVREAIALGTGRRNLPALRPKAVGAGERSVTSALVKDSREAGGAMKAGLGTNAKGAVGKGLFEGHGKNIMIGAGIAVGVYALMNRRGKGTSSGRSGTTRY